MKIFEKKNSIQIEEEDLKDAKLSSADFDAENTKKRAFINVLGARLAIKHFFSQKIEANNLYSLYTIHNVLEEIDLADIYFQGIKMDVRLVFDPKEIFIPKSHFQYGILPDAYIVLCLKEDLSSADFLGFFEPDTINKQNANEDFYFYDYDALQKPSEIKSFLDGFIVENKPDISIDEFVQLEEMFVSLVDNEISARDKNILINQLSESFALREKLVEFENFELISKSVVKSNDVIEDGFMNIVGSQQVVEEGALSKSEIQEEFSEAGVKVGPVVGAKIGLDKLIAEAAVANVLLPGVGAADVSFDVDFGDNEWAKPDSSDSVNELPDFGSGVFEDELEEIAPEEFAQVEDLPDFDNEESEEREEAEDIVAESAIESEIEAEDETFEILPEIEDEKAAIEEVVEEEITDAKSEELSESEEFSAFGELPGLEELPDLEEISMFEEVPQIDNIVEEEKIEKSEDAEDAEDVLDLDSFDFDMLDEEKFGEVEKIDIEDQEDFKYINLDEIDDEEISEETLKPEKAAEFDPEADLIERIRKMEEEETEIEEDIVHSSQSIKQDFEPEAIDEYDISEITSKVDELLKDVVISDEQKNLLASELAFVEEQDDYIPSKGFVPSQTSEPSQSLVPIASESRQSGLTDDTMGTLDFLTESKDMDEVDKDLLKNLFDKERINGDHEISFRKKSALPQFAQNKKMIIAASVASVVLASVVIGGIAINNKNQSANLPADMNAPAPIATDRGLMQDNPQAPPGMDMSAQQQIAPLDQTIGQTMGQAGQQQSGDTLSSRDMSKAVSDAFLSEPVNASVSKVAWEVPEDLAYNDSFRKYLQIAGKNLKLTLQNDLLLATEMAYSNKVVVDLEINKDGSLKSSNISVSSGSKQIDKIVLQSVKETLKYLKMPSSELNSSSVPATLIINF